MLRARHQVFETAQRLTAVAYTQSKRVLALEEALELFARASVIQNGLRPAEPGTEHVTVRKPAAGGQPAEAVEREPALQDVGHVHVDRHEPSAVEGGGHFNLPVDALLSQDRYLRTFARALDERPRGVESQVVAQRHVEPGYVRITDELVLLVGALRVVAQTLQLEAGLGPDLPILGSRCAEHLVTLHAEADAIRLAQAAQRVDGAAEPDIAKALKHVSAFGASDLDHGAQLFTEQGSEDGVGFARVFQERVERDADPDPTREGHLA